MCAMLLESCIVNFEHDAWLFNFRDCETIIIFPFHLAENK